MIEMDGLFSSDGMPLRATVSIILKSIETVMRRIVEILIQVCQ